MAAEPAQSSDLITGVAPVEQSRPLKFVVRVKNLTPQLLSFDIGISHLSYNARDITGRITGWEVIDLLQSSAVPSTALKCRRPKSQSPGTSAAYCGRSTTHYHPTSLIGYCALHARSAPDQATLQPRISPTTVTDWDLKLALYRWLTGHPEFLSYPTILIERQPDQATEKIRGLAYALYDYFVLQYYLNSNGRAPPNLVWMDPRKKLTIYTGEPITCHLKTQYARNKWYSKEYAKWYLTAVQPQPSWLTYFLNHAKQDDLADCLLQSVAWTTPQTSRPEHRRESAQLRYARVKPRRPAKTATARGHYSLANLKYLRRQQTDPKVIASCQYWGLTVDEL
jgi:hypothetical protein